MKKALQVAHFRADLSLPDGAAGIGPREACARSFFHCFAKFFRLDRGGPRLRLVRLLESGLRERGPESLGRGRRRPGKRARSELQPPRSRFSEHLSKARKDLPLELAELE